MARLIFTSTQAAGTAKFRVSFQMTSLPTHGCGFVRPVSRPLFTCGSPNQRRGESMGTASRRILPRQVPIDNPEPSSPANRCRAQLAKRLNSLVGTILGEHEGAGDVGDRIGGIPVMGQPADEADAPRHAV